MDSCPLKRNKRNTHMLYDCRDISGVLEEALVWIHLIHQNLCRTQWLRVGNNIDSRDNRFVYGYVTLPLSQVKSPCFSSIFIRYTKDLPSKLYFCIGLMLTSCMTFENCSCRAVFFLRKPHLCGRDFVVLTQAISFTETIFIVVGYHEW